MAINLVVKEYCSECFDFEPDVTRPERVSAYMIDMVTNEMVTRQSDTIVRCKYAKRCEAIKRYLSQQKGSKDEA